ncbi:MAG: PhzF family phenazine biosynthesis protein [Gemmatimonadaceae bacterium]|nr:PhzF family phenazine biosynthesis protein [Gemmatimonadaceae bacterium]
MPRLRYVTADVFTSAPFTGNPLAVVFGADALPTETLLSITKEFNYSETVFVFPPDDPSHTRRVRIFTPEGELPFAGHPTVGTAHVLVALGEVPADGTSVTVVLGEGVGPVPVRVRIDHGVPVHAQLTTAMLPEERDDVPTIAQLADILSLAPGDFVGGAHSPRAVTCGIPWLIVPLASVDAVRRARIRMEPWERDLAGRWGAWPFVFAMTDGNVDRSTPAHVHGVDIRARAFLPGAAVPEDPATGSANACLAGYLAARTPRDGTLQWEVAQGVEMSRASRLSLEVQKSAGGIEAVRVGGATVLVNEGTMRVP